MGRDEVLKNGQALHEVGLDRTLDDLALRIGHQATHAGQLTNLTERATSAGVGHHEDRVERVKVVLHRFTNLIGCCRPLVGDRLVALLLSDQTHCVLVLDLTYFGVEPVENVLLGRRDDDIVLGNRDSGLS